VLASVIISVEADDCVGVVVAVCAATTVVVASLCPALIKAAPARTCAVIDRYSWLCRDTSVTLVDYPRRTSVSSFVCSRESTLPLDC